MISVSSFLGFPRESESGSKSLAHKKREDRSLPLLGYGYGFI